MFKRRLYAPTCVSASYNCIRTDQLLWRGVGERETKLCRPDGLQSNLWRHLRHYGQFFIHSRETEVVCRLSGPLNFCRHFYWMVGGTVEPRRGRIVSFLIFYGEQLSPLRYIRVHIRVHHAETLP
jgi:hypothetical protein